MAHPKDQITTDEREAIQDAVDKALATPKPTSISSTDMKAAIDDRCQRCRAPGGAIGELWAEFNPIRKYVWMIMGAVAILAVVVGITVPRINSKLDALDEMAKDMAALKVQVNFLIARPGAELKAENPTHIAQGETHP